MITVQLLGGACLRRGDALLVGPPAQRHRIALLTLVVGAWPQPLTRDRTMALLWPERDLAGARRLLNLAVHVLRAALGEGAIASVGDGLLFVPSHVTCDLHALRTAIVDEEHERIVRLYTGTLLDGFHLDDSAEFSYWLDEQRRELEHAYVGALLAMVDRQRGSGDVQGRVRTCRRLVSVDPHSSSYARALMQALADVGDWTGVAEHASEHARRRRADLELDPDPDVVALAERLRISATARHPMAASNGAAPSVVVAVLPFRNLSAEPENEYFADGITEDVIAHLSKIRALTVISRASVMRFKDRHVDLPTIGSALGATSVLEGSVRRAGERVRIVAQLMDVSSGRHVWSETYDRNMTDIFAIQTEVALRIASALQAGLSPHEHSRLRRQPTTDVLAYHLFLRGREWYVKFTADAALRAVDYFDRALARDPEFALAHASQAMAHVDLVELGAMAPEAGYRRALVEVSAALRLDPELAEAHYTMGYLLAAYEFDWEGAEREFLRALELKPSDADAIDLYGRFCSALCRDDDAIALLTRAHELDPLAHGVDVVTALLRAGRIAEAVPRAEEVAELSPSERSSATLGWAYFFAGRKEEGIAELERAVAGSTSIMWLAQLGLAYGLAGKKAKARAVLRTLEEQSKRTLVSPYHLAYVHTGLGDAERALDFLERAVAERTGPTFSIKGSFLFAPLREHPRFIALLREMNLD